MLSLLSLTCDLSCSYEMFEVLAVFASTVLVNRRAVTIVINLWFVLQLREVWSVGGVCQYRLSHHVVIIVINLWFVLQLREVWSVGGVCQYRLSHRAVIIVINLWFVLQLREVWSVGGVCQYNAGSVGIALHYKREVRLVQLLPFLFIIKER